MRLKTFFLMAIVSLTAQMMMVSCSTDDGESSGEKDDKAYKTIVLGSDSYTKDGYFDGLLYYKITSNSDMTVILSKAESSAQNVEIPKYVIINGEKYAVTEIGSEVFDNMYPPYNGLKSIIIPNSVTTIGYAAFRSCEKLTSLTIPNSVTSIGGSAFSGCIGLTSLTIPNSVTSIGGSAFSGCSGLTSLTIPNSVTSIGNDAFYGCSGLKVIYCQWPKPSNVYCETSYNHEIMTFSGVKFDECILYVPKGTLDAYKSTEPWNRFTNIVEV